MKCRFCTEPLEHVFCDLGFSPPSNSFLSPAELNQPEVYFPLKVFVCANCFLVQIDEFKKHSEIFSKDYLYFSSFSSSWLAHSKKYVETVIPRFDLNEKSLVVEIASNDGYLLQYFNDKKIPCIGIEPTASTAAVARAKGIETIEKFWGHSFAAELVSQRKKADLILGNNVFAHVPDLIDFVKGLKAALADEGVITLEFPHLLSLIKFNQFDTIYHEHFSYLSASFSKRIFESLGLRIFDIEELPTHGGSLRLFICHEKAKHKVCPAVLKVINDELEFGLNKIETYQCFQAKVESIRMDAVEYLIAEKKKGKKVVAYGAAAKGNTFLNFCGIKSNLIDFVCDASTVKQGLLMPGSHIQVVDKQTFVDSKPDVVVLLPWNLETEILKLIRDEYKMGSTVVRFIPEFKKV